MFPDLKKGLEATALDTDGAENQNCQVRLWEKRGTCLIRVDVKIQTKVSVDLFLEGI